MTRRPSSRPRTYADGHFLRRTRRALAHAGVEASVRFVLPPEWRRDRTRLVEVEATLGHHRCISHHHVGTGRPTETDVLRIVHNARPDAVPLLPTVDQVAWMMDRHEIALGHPIAREHLVLRRAGYGCGPVDVHRLHEFTDLVGDVVRQELAWPVDKLAGDGRSSADTMEGWLKAERKRRRDLAKGPRVEGLLALVLAAHPRGGLIARNLKANITRTLDSTDLPGEMHMTALTDVTLGFDEIEINASASRITLVKATLAGGAVCWGRTIRLPLQVPTTIAIGLGGRRLDEIVSGLPLPAGLVIASARSTKAGLVVTPQVAPMSLEDMVAALDPGHAGSGADHADAAPMRP